MSDLEKVNEFNKTRYNQLFYAVLQTSELLISDQGIDEVMTEVVQILGQAAEVDCCYIYKNEYEGEELTLMHYSYEWVNTTSQHTGICEICQTFSWSELESLKRTLLAGNCYFADASKVEDVTLKSKLLDQGSLHVLFVPIINNRKLWGVIGFDLKMDQREWLDMEISTFVTISANLAAFIKRNELTIELEKQYQSMNKQRGFYESILSNMPAQIIVLDKNQKYLFANKNTIRNQELREWIVGKDDFDFCERTGINPEVAENRKALFDRMLADKLAYTFEEKFPQDGGKYIKQWRNIFPVFNANEELVMAIGYGLDITKLSEQEDTILKQNEIISNSPDGVALLDQEGRYLYMNKAHEEIFEFEKDGLIGKNWQTLYEKEELVRIQNEVFPILGAKRIWNGQTVGRSKSGKAVYQDLTLRLLPDDFLICITRDVSDLVKSVQLLEQSNQKLELAINTSKLGMWEWDFQTDKLISNDIYRNILGFEKDKEFFEVKNTWLENIHPDDRKNMEQAFNEHLLNVKANSTLKYNNEYRIKTNQENYIWVLDFGKVVEYTEQGEPKLMIGFILDITNNKKIEEQIRLSEKRYRDLVVNLREVIFEADEKAKFVFLNPAWTYITGYSLEESIGKGINHFYDKELDSEADAVFNSFVANQDQKNLNLEFAITHENGQQIWFDAEINKVMDSHKVLTGFVGSFENITVRKSAELELKKALEAERQLGYLKSRFVTMASHEFRTPLAGIRTSAELVKIYSVKYPELGKLFTDLNLYRKLDNIIFDVDKITSLMTDVLTMGKIDASKVNFDPMPQELVAFVEEYLMEEAARYLGDHILTFEKTDPSIMVSFDPKLLIHVLNNLFNNASKYSNEGTTITVTVSKQEDMALISIADQGIGIPEKEVIFSFDSFFRSSNVENIPGTGLGLSIAKYFMDLHKGKIYLQSSVGKGTMVTVELPVLNS